MEIGEPCEVALIHEQLELACATTDQTLEVVNGDHRVELACASALCNLPNIKKKRRARKPKNGHIKRPMNKFMLWARQARVSVAADHPEQSNDQISKQLGKLWKAMSDDLKKPWEVLAEQVKREHALAHPDYKFRPVQKKGGRGPTAPRSPPIGKSTRRRSPSPPCDVLDEIMMSLSDDLPPPPPPPEEDDGACILDFEDVSMLATQSGTCGEQLPSIPPQLWSLL